MQQQADDSPAAVENGSAPQTASNAQPAQLDAGDQHAARSTPCSSAEQAQHASPANKTQATQNAGSTPDAQTKQHVQGMLLAPAMQAFFDYQQQLSKPAQVPQQVQHVSQPAAHPPTVHHDKAAPQSSQRHQTHEVQRKQERVSQQAIQHQAQAPHQPGADTDAQPTKSEAERRDMADQRASARREPRGSPFEELSDLNALMERSDPDSMFRVTESYYPTDGAHSGYTSYYRGRRLGYTMYNSRYTSTDSDSTTVNTTPVDSPTKGGRRHAFEPELSYDSSVELLGRTVKRKRKWQPDPSELELSLGVNSIRLFPEHRDTKRVRMIPIPVLTDARMSDDLSQAAVVCGQQDNGDQNKEVARPVQHRPSYASASSDRPGTAESVRNPAMRHKR